MASTLAAQLQTLQKTRPSTLSSTVDPKALRKLHSVSLLFTPEHAATQDFDTIYSICYEGFEELCSLDHRFAVYERSLFSEQSVTVDRDVLSRADNERLDENVKGFLEILGQWVLVKSGVKALEWLVRRFRVHYHNGSLLILTFLPYHQHPFFLRLLSILPQPLPDAFKFLTSYRKAIGTPIPRSVLIQSFTTRPVVFDLLAQHVISVIKAGHGYATLARFWSALAVKTLSAMLDRTVTKSRTGVTEDDVARQMLPIIADSLQAGKKHAEFQIATYMLLSLLSSRCSLEDSVICATMETVTANWTAETVQPAIAALSLLSQRREGMAPETSLAVAAAFLKLENVADKLLTLGQKYRADKLAVGICLAVLKEEKLRGFKSVAFVKAIFERGRITDGQREAIMQALIEAVLKSAGAGGPLKELLGGFKENKVLVKLLKGRDDELERLELSLGMVLMDDLQTEPKAIEAGMEEDSASEKKSVDEPKIQEKFDAALAALPDSNEVSVLESSKSELYPLLSQALLAAAANPETLAPQLFSHPSLSSSTLRTSFIVRFSMDSYPVVAKETALNHLKEDIKTSDLADYQALLPYLLIILLDTSQRVRKAGILCIAAIYARHKSVDKKSRKSVNPPVWAEKDLYGSTSSEHVKKISFEELFKFVDAISNSGVEGCMLDSTQIKRTFALAVSSLKTSMKKGVLAYHASHILNVPLLHIKTALLSLINGVSGSARTDLLLPLFVWWRSTEKKKEVSGASAAEVQAFQDQLIGIVDAKDHGEGVNALVGVIKSAATDAGMRGFAAKASGRLQTLWNSGLRDEVKPALAMSLLRLIVGDHPDVYNISSTEALEVLRNVTLSADIYRQFITEVVPDHPSENLRQTSKRRRSFSREVEARLPQQMKELTVVLELLEGDQPERFPELLPTMFLVLGKALAYVEASPVGGDYMIQVLLSCLTAIVNGQKQSNPGKLLDGNSIRADIIVNCIRSTSSPQLQNSALLLIATLADIAPDVVFHSVMPIFTFMGANVLRQDDEYSAHVIEQTIHRVIPPLLQSLRTQSASPAVGVSEILGNFVAAFQHVPAHRRMRLYMSLSQSMGSNEYLYALLLLLGEKLCEEKAAGRHMAVTIREFCENFCAAFSAGEQMGAFVRYLEVCVDLAGPRPAKDSLQIFRDKQMGKEQREGLVEGLMELASVMIKGRKLRGLVTNAQKIGAAEEVTVLKGCFVEAVKSCLKAGQMGERVGAAAEGCLKALLDLLPIPLFVDITGELIKDASSPYRTGILATFKTRISTETKKASQDAALDFLPELAALLSDESAPENLRAEAVSCVSVITDKYGKDKQDAIANLVETITGKTVFGSDDEGLQVLSILCLISMIRCLSGRIIQWLPRIAPPAISLLEKEMEKESPVFLIHNAVYPLLEDLVKTIPNFMPSYLERILKVSYTAAVKQGEVQAARDEESDDEEEDNEDVLGHIENAKAVRIGCLTVAAKKIPGKAIVKAVIGTWDSAVAGGIPALKELFQLLTRTVEVGQKAEFSVLQDGLFRIFIQAFDIRNIESVIEEDEDDIEEVEGLIFKALLQTVFKLNDKVFRPFFGNLLKWTGEVGKGDDADEKKLNRLKTFYGFFNMFLESLGSIVTNYYASVLSSTVGILEKAKEGGAADEYGDEKLYKLVLNTLIKSFANDQDDFWQSPTNFEKISNTLIGQLELAEGTSGVPDEILSLIVQSIGELSVAAHTEDHDKAINSAVLKHMRYESSGAVRLWAVKTMTELYERHKEEWIGLLPESMPTIAELMEDDDEAVERETQRLIVKVEEYYGESLESLLT